VLDARERVRVLQREGSARERRLHVAALVVELVADVGARLRLQRGQIREVARERLARVHERRAGRERRLEGGHGRDLLVLHLDEVEGFHRRRLVDGGHRHHRLALVAHDVGGEQRPIAQGGAVGGVAPGEVRRREHGVDAAQRAGALDTVDAHDPGGREGRAQQPRVRHAGHLQIAQVARAPRDLLERIGPSHRSTDDREAAPRAHRVSAAGVAQERMASRILR
jgi:hypothetical protein